MDKLIFLELRHPRIRFNGGFWDGVNDEKEAREPMFVLNGVKIGEHHDGIYEAAYWMGREVVREGREIREWEEGLEGDWGSSPYWDEYLNLLLND